MSARRRDERRRWAVSAAETPRGGSILDGPIGPADAEEVRLDELLDVAVEDVVDLPGLDAGAEILHHPIRLEDVAPDLRAEVDVLLLRLRRVARGGPLLLLELVELGAQDLPGDAAVLLLAALVLDRHHDARGDVREPDGGVGLVHFL